MISQDYANIGSSNAEGGLQRPRKVIVIVQMLVELERGEFSSIRLLFEGPHLGLVVDAMVEGNSPARIWVSDREEPKSAYVWDKAHGHYLAGDDSDEAFDGSLTDLFANVIVPEALCRGRGIYKLHYTSRKWREKAPRIIPGVAPIKAERCLYRYDRTAINSLKEMLPPGFTVRPIDERILKESGLRNTDQVRAEVRTCWDSVRHFVEKGFGFCVTSEEEIVCWCTAEYVSSGKCGIGVETVEKHRTRGFATLATKNFVQHCLEKGITPHWDCWTDNVPSVKVAEKIGFNRIADYAVLFGSFDEFECLLIRADHQYRTGEYRESAQSHERALIAGEERIQAYHFYNAACAWAKAGESEAAFGNLERAIEKGWSDTKRLRESAALRSLRGSERWKKLVAKVDT